MSDPRDHIETDERPWGRFTRYAHNERCTVKIIEVAPAGVLSLQRHTKRDELWVALDAGLTFQIGEDEHAPEVGVPFLVPAGAVHRVRGGDAGGRFLEVAFGEFDEDDIERLDDAYGRS